MMMDGDDGGNSDGDDDNDDDDVHCRLPLTYVLPSFH